MSSSVNAKSDLEFSEPSVESDNKFSAMSSVKAYTLSTSALKTSLTRKLKAIKLAPNPLYISGYPPR